MASSVIHMAVAHEINNIQVGKFFAKAQQAEASSSLRLIKLKQVIELTLFYVSWIAHEHIINVKGMKIFRNCPTKQDSFRLPLPSNIKS